MTAFRPVKPFAGRSRPSCALDPERTAQVDPFRTFGGPTLNPANRNVYVLG
jgi:hypothetical protein